MPEGDTILLAARGLDRALAGREVVRFESAFARITRIAEDQRVTGRTIESVTARGKHLLIAFSPLDAARADRGTIGRSGGLVLRTHMRMNGSWHVYRPGERWQRPRRDMRIVVATDAYEAVAFMVPIAEFIDEREAARQPDLRAIGPDLLGDTFDASDALRRIHERGRETIADVLLNQRVVAGIGNVFKSEILFLATIYPFTLASSVSDGQFDELITIARRVMAVSVTVGRWTTRSSLNPAERLRVYTSPMPPAPMSADRVYGPMRAGTVPEPMEEIGRDSTRGRA